MCWSLIVRPSLWVVGLTLWVQMCFLFSKGGTDAYGGFVLGTASAQGYRGGCDKLVRLGLNDSFTFSVFPPAHVSTPHPYGYASLTGQAHHDGPEECTWVFVGEKCQLEFRQRLSAYNRGDVDCDEQYFLFGDENQEERFCGFKKPPLRLLSTGSRLFMTHFQRNRRYGQPTISSRIGGEVWCRAPPPRVCSLPRSCSPVAAAECPNSGSCSMALAIQPFGGQLEFSQTIDCNSASGKKCQELGQMCFETVPVNSTVPQLPPVPPIPGAPNCSEPIQVSCPNPGNCTAFFGYGCGSGQVDPRPCKVVTSTCVAQPGCTCVFQGNVCYTPQ